MRFILGLRFAVRGGFVVLWLCLFFGATRAEVTKIDEVAEFSEAIHLSFEELPAVGSDSYIVGGSPLDTVVLEGGEYATLGVTLMGERAQPAVRLLCWSPLCGC